MVELAVGDLYDQIASQQEGVVICPEAIYECKYCAMFQISGSELRDSDRGRSHAAAHRITFEALLEPAPVLICPICDLPQKTSEVACVFGCMFNDLDLVEHLERDHSDILADDMVCDFSDPRYLFTTFQEKQATSSISDQRSTEQPSGADGDDDRNTIVLSDADEESGANSTDEEEMEQKYSPDGAPNGRSMNELVNDRNSNNGHSTSGVVDMEANDSHETGQPAPSTSQVQINRDKDPVSNVDDTPMDTERSMDKHPQIVHHKTSPRKQMAGVSIITCLACGWSPSSVHDANRMRNELSSHVRLHIRGESGNLPGRSDSFFADKRLLSCMDFSLEEYFEKEHLTDLSGTINSRIMERVYGDLLATLFGVCVPLVYRILHGNNGNPFRSPDTFSTKRRKTRRVNRSKGGKDSSRKTSSRAGKDLRRTNSTSTLTTDSLTSDADSSTHENMDLLGIGNFESDQHIQCARAECGHYLLTPSDRISIVRHVAAHIRHDEMRLLKTAGVSPLVACDCGVAMGSPMGYIYHIVHDHVFERKKFSDLAATIVSYLMLIVETAIESVLAVRVDFRAIKWTFWCAYFALENDEGDENLFIDSTDLNEHWWKLWESLLDECMTGKSMTLGDTIKLFEMHPFVHEERLRIRKHKSIPVMDADRIQRSLSSVWLHLTQWSNDPIKRVHLASESRWIRLAQIRRRVFLECKKGDQGKPDSWRSITVCTIPSSFEFKQRQLPTVAADSSPVAVRDSDAATNTSGTANDSMMDVVDATPQEDATTSTNAETSDPQPSSGFFADLLAASRNSCQTEEEAAAAELSGKHVRCTICADVCIRADNTAYIKNHCALHAVLEGRMLCSLYIHRAADRPQMCPFCPTEMNVYKPTEFLEHIRKKHENKSRTIYDRFLSRFFPVSKVFTAPAVEDNPKEDEQCRSDFIIRCQRSSCCGVDPVIILPNDKAIALANVDIAVVKHMLWHVRNDSFLELDSVEREVLTRALMIRLSCAQMRQVLFMARRVAKQFNKYKETELIRYIQEKVEEIGCTLFGMNKGLVFQMVFTRRFVRDQSGMQLYPPCVCRLCVDKELPRYSSDRRKRAFVAYAHPVVLHILEHLSAGQLPQNVTSSTDIMRWESACAVDGLRFKNVSMAIKHVLDAHNDLVELSALDLMLEDMGIFQLFRDAISSALGDQAWQLEEALGFGAYTAKVCPRPDFFNETETESIHRPDCTRPWDTSTQLCACSEPVPSQQGAGASADLSLQPRSRMRATSLRDMPEASAACYEEFLHESEDREEQPSLPSFNASGDDEQATSNLQSSSASLLNSTMGPSSSLPAVKVETEEAGTATSSFDNSVAALADGISATDQSSADGGTETAENRMASSKKKRPDRFKRARQKRVKEIKREIDGLVVPQRYKTLPLKNVIQGSKTVAAALAAALGSPSSTTEGSHTQTTSQPEQRAEQQEATKSAAQPPASGSRTNSTTSDGNNDETELALGRVAKKPRLATGARVGTEVIKKVDSIASDYFRRRLRPPR